jgi:hypothetical protein
VPRGGPKLIKLTVAFDAALGAGVEGEFREEFWVCRLNLRPPKANEAKYQGDAR